MNTLKFSLAFFLIIFTFSIAISQEKPPGIEVTGTASISVTPDIMKWTVDIQNDNDNVQEAKTRNDNTISKVLGILKNYNIEDKDIKTSGIRMTKKAYRYGDEKKYSVSNTVWFTLENIAKYDLITNDLIRIEDVFITNTTLEYSKAIETRVQARTNALLVAKEKAVKMAEALGMTIGKPILIQEEPIYDYWGYPNYTQNNVQNYAVDMPNSSQHFSEGIMKIESKVKVVFELK
ncbi:MAG: SIMPL domain-containing protein [Ignavibacteriae bacterium]|nr:SIMPL domain-containing protein [Ignavibacteriota bacterium]